MSRSRMEIVDPVCTTPESTVEGDLLQQARSGNADAFSALYRLRANAVYRFAVHMTGNGTIAEEVLQDTFLALIRDGVGYDPERGSVGAYIFGIARNRVRKYLTREREWVEPAEDLPGDVDLLAGLTRKETINAVRQAVAALPHAYREVVVLCDIEELSYEEAAQVMNCPIGTVRSRLHRSRAMLLTKLVALKENGLLI